MEPIKRQVRKSWEQMRHTWRSALKEGRQDEDSFSTITLEIEAELYELMKQRAKEEHISIQELTLRAVRQRMDWQLASNDYSQPTGKQQEDNPLYLLEGFTRSFK